MADTDKPTPKPAAGQPQSVSIRYVDRPDCLETFADSIANLSFDGQALRIDFAVTRMDDVRSGSLSGRRYPVARLVLPPGAAVELINRMQQIGAALTKAGVLRTNPPAEKPAETGRK